MVRIAALSLILSGCVAEDVYYHTQLLQTKMNSHKVSIDTSGDVSHDENTLFQKVMRQTSSKKAAGAKLLKVLGKHLVKGKPKRGREGPPPPPPELAGPCMMLYGHDVDLPTCGTCLMQVMGDHDEQAMMEDPNAEMRRMANMADDCMGQTNVITSTCDEHYGDAYDGDVPLFDCMMCGEMCQCSLDEGCALGEDCHPSCMAGDPEGDFEDDEDCSDECKLFYGPEADAEQCEECGHTCFEEANGAVETLAMSGAEVNMEDFERTWFETLISCSDACMAPLVNLPEQACKGHYGEDVDLIACYTCGMECGCDLEGECEWCDHGECMAGDLNLLQKSNKTVTAKGPFAPKVAFARMQTRAKKAAAKKLRQLKQRRNSKVEAFGKLMKHKTVHQGKPGKKGKKGSEEEEEPPCDAEVEGTCMMLYGHDVDMGACAACYGEVAPHYDEGAMMEDPNAMVRMLADMADACMGTTNLITSTCEQYYGPEVLLFDCMMCGEICQCTLEGGCAAGEDCHPGCMEGDSGMPSSTYGDYEDDGECADECQLFYGPEADPEQCEECGHRCFEEANGAVEELAMSGAEVGMEDFERTWFETMISCADACMAPLVNLPEQVCKGHYGEEVDLVACYSCGMMCGCDLEGNCEWCDHGACMAGEYDYDSSTWSSYSDYSSWPATYSSTWPDSKWESSWDTSYGSYNSWPSYWDSSYGSWSYPSWDSSKSSSWPSYYTYGDSTYGGKSSYTDSYGSYSSWPDWDSTWTSSDSSYSWLQKAQKRATKVLHPMQKSKKLHKRFQFAMTKMARKTMALKIAKSKVNDETDLMQTRQHLKK